MALGLYTALPGFARWDEDCAPLLPAALPAVGLFLGLLWCGLAALFRAAAPPMLAAAAVALTMPVLTGFLHLDGFMDVSDAVLSSRPREERLRILKDPHAGGFSVISVAGLLLTAFGACHGLLEKDVSVGALIALPVVSRALAAIALMSVAPLGPSVYGKLFHQSRTPAKQLGCTAAVLLATLLSFAFGWRAGVACLFAALAFAAVCLSSVRALGGVNGDVAGCSICCAEVAGLIALACL